MSKALRVSLALVLCAATGVVGQTRPSLEDSMKAYRNAVVLAESGCGAAGVESALAAVEDLRQALLAPVPGESAAYMERLSDEEFAAVRQLPGVFVRRREILVVRPVPGFFAALATKVGHEADRRLTAALAATYPRGHWPVYVREQAHYSGCTDFEEGRLLETYLGWSAMRRDFPSRYVSVVDREHARVVDEITRSTCSCAAKASVVGELERIAAGLPHDDPILEAVEARLRRLDRNRSGFRFHCVSG